MPLAEASLREDVWRMGILLYWGTHFSSKDGEENYFLRVSMLLALQKSSLEQIGLSTLWAPRPMGSASLIWGRWVERSRQSYSGFLLSAPLWCVSSSACGGWRPTAGLLGTGVPQSQTHLASRLLSREL